MKRISITLASLLLAGAAQAQVGIRVGANAATVSTKTNSETQRADADHRSGYQLGVFYEKKLTDRISIVPEVQFSRQHMNIKMEEFGIADGGYNANYQLRLSYLSVPILARATFGKFYLEAGPQLGLLLNANEDGAISYGTIAGTFESTFDRRATASYHKFDVGVAAGVGVKMPAGFGLGVRAYTGLAPINRRTTHSAQYNGTLRNQSVQASLTYQLGSQ